MTTKKWIIVFGIFGILFVLAAAILLLSGPRMNDQPSLRTFDTIMALPPSDAITFYEKEDSFHKNISESFGYSPKTKNETEAGRVYYGYFCKFCHGEDGKGNGPVGESYIPKPADLTQNKIGNYPMEKLYTASFTGTGHEPVLERVVPVEYRQQILQYVQETLSRKDSTVAYP